MTKKSTSGNLLTPVMEDYLEAIYHLVQKHGHARSGQISLSLNVHKSTVTTALHSLQSQGFIEYAPYQSVTMTSKGEKEARGIVRRHDIFFRLLHHLLGVEKEEASALACEMEHAIPPEIVDRFVALVENALQRQTDARQLYDDFRKNHPETTGSRKKAALKKSVQK